MHRTKIRAAYNNLTKFTEAITSISGHNYQPGFMGLCIQPFVPLNGVYHIFTNRFSPYCRRHDGGWLCIIDDVLPVVDSLSTAPS